ncbi:DUF6492 family protein [Ruegeria sp. R14_0]|uniref:DUF6492 family protein n=1 Tax=Ruegeria sp. R14_0 TaxID=2821100 RepID=UPI001ADCBCDE|nr:DUF6492 family protein [Ruegeria sp. R14_0]MBO9446568.1 hypothetical protein [Ruegeria sp. R14_0]
MLSFATVVFSKDFPLLELQALSFARFVDPDQVGSIHVILNDSDEDRLRTQIEPILNAYGPHRQKVQVVGGDELLLQPGQYARRSFSDRVLIENRFRIPGARKHGWRGTNGYRSQQVLKLGAARVAATENMVILDTKNLFLRSFDGSEFFADSGAARMAFINVESEFHRNWLLQSLDALGAPQVNLSGLRTTTFSTPFAVRRSLVLALLDEINALYGSVQSLFGSRRRPSEFMLMNAFCLKSSEGYAPWFEDKAQCNIGIWPSYSPEVVETQLAMLEDPAALTLGLHNRALSKLPVNLRDRVFAELEHRGICDRSHAEQVLNRTASLTG